MKFYAYFLVAFLLGAAVAWGQLSGVPRGRTEIDDGMEVLTRGPVHEAFAETVTFDPEPGIVTPKMPPVAIEEVPPDQRPEGTNVAWIPGYWAWDDERTDFLWVSGVWRALPPGRQWVPGYWGRAGQGAQWTSGYWADSESTEAEYLPEPPASVESGPNVPAPSVNHIWLPGTWLWQQNRYAWRPGYWAPGQSNWDWIPAHYVWTPRGYLFVDGYYDYTVARRGVLFAPVYFNSNSYSQQGFSYRPATVINPAVFASHLFLRPSYGHYYFGDYYGSNYSSNGFSPWFSFFSSRSGYDPFYAQQYWQNRNNGQWNRQVQADFTHRQANAAARPPRTFAAQQQLGGNGPKSQNMASVIAQQLDQFRKTADSSMRFQPVNDGDRQQFGRRGQDVQSLREQRQQLEAKVAEPTAAPSAQGGASARVKLPTSPFVAKRPEAFDEHQRPPQSHAQPQVDSNLVPTPRRRGNSSVGTSPVPSKEKAAPKTEPKVEPKAAPKKAASKDKPKGKP
ncbi:MAG: YXWGXW repeat-containing protein [Planctomycetaceae bacterium]|nr:YXWGXW repeat-containing protein [Planctomycetales bacterium]MCB9922414.1 YXWGXW repeat-containing protein [Planctomycetaceae bacterium]